MHLSRRTVLKGVGTLPLAAGNFGFSAFAQAPSAAPSATEVPPILFVHGNGDHAALWITTLWRMESNGVPRERMFAINFTDPLARTDDSVPQQNRSSTEDQRRELGEAIKELRRRTGASRVALVGNSRGGYSIRNHIKNGGAADVSYAVLCGTPNHGIFDWDDNPGYEFNGRGPFLRGLNEGDSEVTAGTSWCARVKCSTIWRRTPRTCSRRPCTETSNPATRSSLHYAGVNTTKASATLRSQEIGIGNRQVIAGDCQVQIVFESEVNRVFQRQVQFAIADQTIQTWRICEYRLGHMIGCIWTEWIMGFWHLQFSGRVHLRMSQSNNHCETCDASRKFPVSPPTALIHPFTAALLGSSDGFAVSPTIQPSRIWSVRVPKAALVSE